MPSLTHLTQSGGATRQPPTTINTVPSNVSPKMLTVHCSPHDSSASGASCLALNTPMVFHISSSLHDFSLIRLPTNSQTSPGSIEMTSSSPNTSEQEPLLQRSHSLTDSIASYNSASKSRNDDEEVSLSSSNLHLDRSVENDVLPETAVLGRNLGWSSAYILIISRVIGSGDSRSNCVVSRQCGNNIIALDSGRFDILGGLGNQFRV